MLKVTSSVYLEFLTGDKQNTSRHSYSFIIPYCDTIWATAGRADWYLTSISFSLPQCIGGLKGVAHGEKFFWNIWREYFRLIRTDHNRFEEHTWTTWKTTYFQGVVIKSSGWLLLKSFTAYEKNPYERACRIVSETSANLLNGIERLNSSLLNWTILFSHFGMRIVKTIGLQAYLFKLNVCQENLPV